MRLDVDVIVTPPDTPCHTPPSFDDLDFEISMSEPSINDCGILHESSIGCRRSYSQSDCESLSQARLVSSNECPSRETSKIFTIRQPETLMAPVANRELPVQGRKDDRLGWEVPFEEHLVSPVHAPKALSWCRDGRVVSSSRWAKRFMKNVEVLSSVDDVPVVRYTACSLREHSPIAIPTRALLAELDVVASCNGCDIDDLAVDALGKVGSFNFVDAGLDQLWTERQTNDVSGENILRPIPALAIHQCVDARSALLAEAQPFLDKFRVEDSRASDRVILCEKTSIITPPISLPGPGPVTEFSRGSLGSHEVDVDELVCQVMPSSKPRVSWGIVDSFDEGENVLLHVYNLNSLASSLGLPIFHVGVEVFGCEVWYGTGGVRKCKPKSLDPQAYIETVLAGQTTLGLEAVRSLVTELEGKWLGENYRILDSNCQSFALEFCKLLGVEDTIPREYVRHGDVPDWARKALVAAIRPNPQEPHEEIQPSTPKYLDNIFRPHEDMSPSTPKLHSSSHEIRKGQIDEHLVTHLDV